MIGWWVFVCNVEEFGIDGFMLYELDVGLFVGVWFVLL